MATRKNKADHYWYARNPSKFRRKTSHLSLMEKGAYSDLLDWYYENRKPLPHEWVQMHRICGAVAPDEQAAVQTVVQQFFTHEEDGWHNKTADEEIGKAQELSQKRADAQAEKERQRLEREAKKGANAPANAPANEPTITITTTDSISNDIESNTPALSSLEISMMFENIWNAYPGRGKNGATGNGYKGSKSRALTAFTKIIKETEKDEHENLCRSITEGAGHYENHLIRSGYPSKHASTWLNERGWEDDYSSNGAAAGRSGGKHERARAILTEDDSTIIEG